MRALDRKLWRDVWRLRGQVLAIAMVIASGVAVLVMSLGAVEALRETASAYYERARFADVFAHVTRAPELLARRIGDIPGVQTVDTRIAQIALLDVKDFPEPVIGQLISIPERGESPLNHLVVRAGRSVAPGDPDEAVISESFAEAHGLTPGSRFGAIINEHRRTLQVVGIAISPEFVYAIGPGALMPDDRRFGIVWMGREALAAAYDLDGAFNDVSLSLMRGVHPDGAIDRLDALLAPYGGVGAYPRADQVSHWFLTNEIDQLETMATILPVIFLAVAAFLTNMVLNRLIALERSEIGLLKAFGYSNAAVGWHYTGLVIVIAGVGVALGSLFGLWFGRSVTEMYAEFFSFPFFLFRPSPGVFVVSAAVTVVAALLGTARAVQVAVRLPPAEAMRPPAPTLYVSDGVSAQIERVFDQPTRMILRHAVRHPARSLATSVGIAMSVGLLVTSLQWPDAFDHLVEVYFYQAQHQDVTVGLVESRSLESARELARLPGVEGVQPVRTVTARLSAGQRSRREVITGVPEDAELQPVFDVSGYAIPIPEAGLVVAAKLAEILEVEAGDRVMVEVLEGRRPVRELPISAVFETYLGTPAYMNIEALSRMMGERPALTAAHLAVDSAHTETLYASLKENPAVAAVNVREAAVQKFHETMAESMLQLIGVIAGFAGMLAFGVAYNATRVSLSERAHELATLRVLGVSRREISYILLGEMALLVFVGLPLGCVVGYGISWLMMTQFETELYRIPFVIEDSTFGWAMLICIAATVASALIVRRRLDKLDLISVLKTRE